MTASRFFDLVLADEGYICIATLDPADGGKMRQYFGTGSIWAEAILLKLDQAPLQIFFGCSNFLTSASRKGDNVAATRSFWIDLDVGPGKPYATRREAVTALDGFERAMGLPVSLLVSSGAGLHAYWPMDADMTPAAWRITATLLKAAATKHGLGQDPTRTADIASVLRPPGTMHRKGDPKEVKVVRWVGQTDHDSFRAALAAYLDIEIEDGIDGLGPMPAHIAPVSNDDLKGGMEYPPAFADRIADQCAVMGMIRETKGRTDQPTWYHGLQLLNRCEDGAPLAHEWSSGDPRYSPPEVDKILTRLGSTGPTLCTKFADYQPALCAACPHVGKIKSPIMLGVEPAAPIAVTAAAPAFGIADPDEVAIDFPHGYTWQKVEAKRPHPQMCIAIKNDKDEETQHAFCDTLFYPVNRLASDNGASMEIEARSRTGKHIRFTIETSVIAKGGDGLASILGKHEIMARPRMKPHMENYLSAWVDKLKVDREAIISRNHFGWHGRSFVLGTEVLNPGSSSAAVLEGNAARKSGAFDPTGTLAEWVRLIDTAYNYEGQEAFQFNVLLAFASPLFSMFKQYGGITAYAHSEGTGVGKTTAQRAGLSAWGNWQDLQLAEGKTTENALWALVGTYHSLPVLFDELTNQANKAASEIVFSVSSGRAKERLGGDGIILGTNANWSTILMASGNSLLSDKIAQHRGNPEAELARLFEFTIRNTSHLSPNEAATIFPKLLENYGHAGREFIRYVVDNYDVVEDQLTKVQHYLTTELDLTQGERYWSALFASVITALMLCRDLDLVRFPVAPLKDWIATQLGRNRVSRDESVSDPLELFGKMLSDLWTGVLVTIGEGKSRPVSEMASVKHAPVGQLTGRAIIPLNGPGHSPMLALSTASVKQWCNKHSVSSREIFDALVREKYARPLVEKYVLGKGTEYATVTTQVRCWILDPVQMGIDVDAPTTNVHDFVVGQQKKVSNDR